MKLPKDYRPAPDLLKDKIILVTGAGDGIGKVAAKTFAAHGATVVLLGRTQSKLEQVYDEIETLGGPQPAIYPFNLEGAAHKEYQDLRNVLEETFGVLHGLVHNAGELGERTPVENYSPDAWMRVMQVNLNAPFLLTQALLPLMERADNASIVFTSSGVAYQGRAFWGAYAASKAGQENFMQTLADELDEASSIRANSINPGATRTRMRATAYPAEDPTTVPTPEAHMPLYLYLLGDDSVGISGQQFQA
ncbi:YciK family oxidoreductase [Marinimicrobium sp. ABcell2]|uniref:YciK family oxidoreductase n=1 Tax=Marinimicrobium sp. ABcell2 TaxID=3069751 RepID=UPI0027AEA1E3|nr:YciK family oxidoreductase [Marinimicrobium sp. ABcell2]MDQ2078066.1 YciK family oxidoreductase [Marinimicrobium sp. ABcell2]